MTDLGALEQVELRTIWQTEAGHFTPWLAREENIALLGRTLGIDLEVEATEQNVGPFRADILCRDTVNNHWVLVENQLTKTDHTHLGQIITYAAGLDAVTVIWIASSFTEEHRAALDWLNRITEEGLNFFALEIELWRIGESPLAPKFNVISKPNDWSRTVKKRVEDGELTETKKLQLDYWTEFRQFMEDSSSFVRCQTPKPQNWTCFAIGKAFFQLVARVNTQANELGAYLCIQGPNRLAHYHMILESHKEEVEASVDGAAVWRELKEAKESQIAVNLKADPWERKDWPNQHAWLKKSLESLHRTLAPIVRDLDASEYLPVDTAPEE